MSAILMRLQCINTNVHRCFVRVFFQNTLLHDDVIKWKPFLRNWPFVRGIHRSPVNSPRNGQWRGALMFSLICARINDWVNNRVAGHLRCYHAHYDVTLMLLSIAVAANHLQYGIWSIGVDISTVGPGPQCVRLAIRGVVIHDTVFQCYWSRLAHNLQFRRRIQWKAWPFLSGRWASIQSFINAHMDK